MDLKGYLEDSEVVLNDIRDLLKDSMDLLKDLICALEDLRGFESPVASNPFRT